jgi:hypothetical protein
MKFRHIGRRYPMKRISIVLVLLLIFPLASFLSGTLSAQTRPVEPRLQGGGTLKVMTYNMNVGTEYAGMLDPSLSVFLQAAPMRPRTSGPVIP